MRRDRGSSAHLLAALLAVLPVPGNAAELRFPDSSGVIATYQAEKKPVRLTGAFFEALSSSGRSCNSCHRAAQGWSISADEVKSRFEATKGLDPIFRTNDGANCDRDIDTKTIESRRAAYSLLLGRGLIRMTMYAPGSAEFEVVNVRNAYGCTDRAMLSMYRRPLPATNLRLLTSVMWDGRESAPVTAEELEAALERQAANAATLHAQLARPLDERQKREIVDFELGLATAQDADTQAGALDGFGARGGATVLATQTIASFSVGINDPGHGDPHAIQAENAFRLFDAWSRLQYGKVYDPNTVPDKEGDAGARRRAAIARGQLVFNQQPFDIRGVAGFNDVRHSPSITGACGTCHNNPNGGNHSTADSMNTGVSDATGPLDVSYLPVIVLRSKATGEVKQTTDPGRALVTGKWNDIGKVKTPVLRGLAARAPYFHNGAAKSLDDVVEFYDKRFHARFSPQQKADLVAFLSSL
jgi:cytochrome c peroxidase